MAEPTALVTLDQHTEFLTKKQDKIARWVSGGVTPDALLRFTLHEMQQNEALRICTPSSVYLALLACAVAGLEPGKLKDEAYIIPYKRKIKIAENGYGREIEISEAKFMSGWKGILHQARRAKINIVANVVKEHDDFDFDLGTAQFLRHKPKFTNGGALIGAYAWAKLPHDGLELEWLDLERINKIRAFADSKTQGGSPAWANWFDQMARKSALRSIGKRIPMGADYYRTEQLELAYDGASGQSVQQVLDGMTDGDATKGAGDALIAGAAFAALPAPAKPERTPEVSSKAAEPAKPASKAKPIDVKATESPTSAASKTSTPPAGSSSPSPSAAASTSSAPASTAQPPTPTASSSTKLDEAKAKVEAKRAGDPTTPAGSTEPATAESSPSTSSQDSSPSEAASGASTDTAFEAAAMAGTVDAGADDDFGAEAPVVPAKKSIDGYWAWLASCRTRTEAREGKRAWLEWAKSPESGIVKGDGMAAKMQDAFGRRIAELPE